MKKENQIQESILRYFFINIKSEEYGLFDAKKAGIFDCLAVKKNAIQLATDAAVTVLSVDQIIMSRQAGGPKPKENQDWDED